MFWLLIGIVALFWLMGTVNSMAASAILYLLIVVALGLVVVALLQGRPPFSLR